MKGFLLPFSLACALVATIGLAVVAMRTGDSQSPSGGEESTPLRGTDGETIRADAGPRLARYQTTATLVEDLRDALAQPKIVDTETWRVSRAIAKRAAWSLGNLVPAESSPRVRALLVLACGVHEAESTLLLELLADRAADVRRASALAIGYRKDGKTEIDLLGARVALGRELTERAVRALHLAYRGEDDATVRDTIQAVLRASNQPEAR